MSSESPATSGRRYDLDWIRVGAFALLIFYHVGMFYVPWDWHVKSPRLVPALAPIMMLTSPWRLTLLFLVSGAASRLLLERLRAETSRPAARFAWLRISRLLPPLLLAIFVIVPPQSYYEVYEALAAMGAPDPAHSAWAQDFWRKYASGSGGWCDSDGCLFTPTWNHMWFVAYLLVYDLILAIGFALFGGALPVQAWLERNLKGWRLFVPPVIWLAGLRLTLVPAFPMTNLFVDDWYNHALSFSAFAFGFVVARSDAVTARFARLRRPALALGLAAWLVLAISTEPWAHVETWRPVARTIYALDQWSFIVAVLGYGAAHWRRGGPLLRYLTLGVFCFYIVHQTLIVVAAHHLATLRLPLGLEATALVAITLAGCWLVYEAARRIGPLGLLLGVRPSAATRPGS